MRAWRGGMVLVSGILWRGTPLLGRDVRVCGRGLGLVLGYCETGGAGGGGGGVFGSGRGGGFVKTGFEGRVEYLVEYGRLVIR